MAAFVLVVFVFILVLVLVFKSYKRAPKNYPPGPPRLPFIGSYLHLIWQDYFRPHLGFDKLAKHYNSPVISFGLGHINAVVANDYESCKEVLTKPAFQGRFPAYTSLLRTDGVKNGIFGNDGDNWLHIRRFTLRALRDFGFGKRSEDFENVMMEEVNSLLNELNDLNGQPTSLPEIFYAPLFNVSVYLVHGYRIPDEQKQFLKTMGSIAMRVLLATDNTGRFLHIWPWLRHILPNLSGYQEIVSSAKEFGIFNRKSLKEHQQEFDENIVKDMYDIYLKNRKLYPHWNDEEILSSSQDLMFPNAAVAIVLAFTMGFLIEHPEKMQRCRKELDDVVGRGRLPNLNDRQHLPMIDACIRETMRYQTLSPLGVAHRSIEDTTLGGYFVPKDSMVFTNLWAVHMDPQLWKDPDTFRPERFLEGGEKDVSLPFGMGKRVCAGETHARQNMFLIVATILQNFNPEFGQPLEKSRYVNGTVETPNLDYTVRFVPRP